MLRKVRAETAADLVAEMRRIRAATGQLPFRELNRIAKRHKLPDPLTPSTTSEILTGKRLPRLPRVQFVESYVTACLIAARVEDAEIAQEVAGWRELWLCLVEDPPPQAPPEHPADRPEQAQQPADQSAPGEPAEQASSGHPLTGLADDRNTDRGPASSSEASPTPTAPGPYRRSLFARRVPTWPLVAGVFLVGVVVGLGGGRAWSAEHPSAADDESAAQARPASVTACLPAGASDPAGEDVLGAPPWWVNNGGVALRPAGATFHANVPAGTLRPGDLVIVKSDVRLVSGRHYVLAFTATASRPTQIVVRAQDQRPPYYYPSFNLALNVGPRACRHVYRFTGAMTSARSELTFQVGGRPADFALTVNDVVLVQE